MKTAVKHPVVGVIGIPDLGHPAGKMEKPVDAAAGAVASVSVSVAFAVAAFAVEVGLAGDETGSVVEKDTA
jgi:hypothetical protein